MIGRAAGDGVWWLAALVEWVLRALFVLSRVESKLLGEVLVHKG